MWQHKEKVPKQVAQTKESFPDMMFELCMEVGLGDTCAWKEELDISETENNNVYKCVVLILILTTYSSLIFVAH